MEPVCDTCAQCPETVVLKGRILRSGCCDLLVCDLCACQEVLVHTPDACRFCPGPVSYTHLRAHETSV